MRLFTISTGLCTALAVVATATALSALSPEQAPGPQPTARCGCCTGGADADGAAPRGCGMHGSRSAALDEARPAGGCPHMGTGAGAGDPAGGAQGHRHGAVGQGRGMGPGQAMRGRGMPELMAGIHFLIDHHQAIRREVENVENGVITVTRAPEDPDLVPAIQKHVRDMWALLESGGSIRHWDPLFVALFEHAEQIEMTYEDLADGIRVVETSDDPEVVALIQAHAAKVNEFVARGRAAMHEPTPLPTPPS